MDIKDCIPEDLNYTTDILGDGYELLTINQPDDYEGSVVCTVVRKKASLNTTLAVLYVHGFNDYFFQKEMAEKFNENGYNFFAIDLRKYGRSFLPHQKFNNVRDLSEYFPDLDKALELIHNEGYTTVLLSGHSTGGLLVTLYASIRVSSNLFSAVFVTSPNFVFNENLIVRRLALPMVSIVGKYWPDILIKGGFSPLYGPSLHCSEKGEWEYNLSWKPHVAPRVNCGFIRAVYQAQNKVKHDMKRNVPVLIMISDTSLYDKKWSEKLFSGDLILNVASNRKIAVKLHGNIQIQEIEGGMHDLVLSPKRVRDRVYLQLFDWLKKNI
jgi:alpha-beta hydrolase superfamily lysophospholipase